MLCFLGACITLWRGRLGQGRCYLIIGLTLLLCLGGLPLGRLIVAPLESRFAARPAVFNPIGIIVLGGGEDAETSTATGLVHLDEAAERLLAGITLAREYPDTVLVFSGGSAAILGPRYSGALVAGQMFREAGVDETRIILEGLSRNTAENAAFTREIVSRHAAVDQGRQWILVTSAFHMPRALGAFCVAGWHNILPYPVDFRAKADANLDWDLAGRLELLNLGLKEWVGLAAYYITGRSAALFPDGC